MDVDDRYPTLHLPWIRFGDSPTSIKPALGDQTRARRADVHSVARPLPSTLRHDPVRRVGTSAPQQSKTRSPSKSLPPDPLTKPPPQTKRMHRFTLTVHIGWAHRINRVVLVAIVGWSVGC